MSRPQWPDSLNSPSEIPGTIQQVVSDRLISQPGKAIRIQCLFESLQYDLQVVSIELEGRDDPQVIFETLNARGEPLLPSDLLRNYLFWRASREKADLTALYRTYWASFDTEFWKAEEKQGRLRRPRVDLFFANLLQAKTTGEVNMGRLYLRIQGMVGEGRQVSEYSA